MPPQVRPVQIQHELEKTLNATGLEYQLDIYKSLLGYEGKQVEPLVQSAEAVYLHLFKEKIKHEAADRASIWTDTNVYNELGIPAIKIGPRGRRIGPRNEEIDIDVMVNAAKLYTLMASTSAVARDRNRRRTTWFDPGTADIPRWAPVAAAAPARSSPVPLPLKPEMPNWLCSSPAVRQRPRHRSHARPRVGDHPRTCLSKTARSAPLVKTLHCRPTRRWSIASTGSSFRLRDTHVHSYQGLLSTLPTASLARTTIATSRTI
jgi:hypothetical protein